MKKYKSSGIVLSSKPYQETDKLITVFTRDLGKKIILAKGAKTLSSKKRGSLELFSIIHFSATKNDNYFDVFSDVTSHDNLVLLRANIKKLSLAYYFVEIVSKSLENEEVSTDVYDLLVKYLYQILYRNDLRVLRLEFVRDLIVALGYWPKDKDIFDVDQALESVLERPIYSLRIGKRITL